MPAAVEFIGLETIPEIKPGDNLAAMITDCARREGVGISDGDIIVITSKILSKALGLTARLDQATPSRRAKALAWATGLDPRAVAIMMEESHDIVGYLPLRLALGYAVKAQLGPDPATVSALLAEEPALLLTQSPAGGLATDAGSDASNAPPGHLTLLPADPDAVAHDLRAAFARVASTDVAVIIADTEMRFTRLGTEQLAIGVAGMDPLRRDLGRPDRRGRPKLGGIDGVADQVAQGAGLLMGQTSESVPVVIVRGLAVAPGEQGAKSLAVRPRWLAVGVLYVAWSWLKLRVAGLLAFLWR